SSTKSREMRSRYSFAQLVRPYVGLISSVNNLVPELGSPDLESATASLGNLAAAFPQIRPRQPDRWFGGSGGGIDPDLAWVRAVFEGAEPNATMVFSQEDFVVASADSLGPAALDLSSIPRCSDEEYRNPRCPLKPAQMDQPIRWVRGYSLVDGRAAFVPAV